MTKKIELPNFASEIKELLGQGRQIPPVENWQPQREADLDLVIKSDGVWCYEGKPMERESVVQLFATILRKDGDEYFLVTPVEKLRIQVEHLPFVVRMIDVEGEGSEQKIHCSTSVGDHFTIGKEHPLFMAGGPEDDSVPQVLVRSKLFAKLLTPVYYELADRVEESASEPDTYGIWSDGEYFTVPV